MKYQCKIKRDGTIEFLGKAPPRWPMPTIQTRFSEIVPDYIHPVKARVFRILRRLFGETGRVAAWTRRWNCMWVCVILRGPHRGRRSVSRNRQTLIQWEQNLWAN